jgi:FkbM family methyltransferase
MNTPIPPTEFPPGLYKPEWFARDYIYTPDGQGEFPNHHCKKTFEVSFPFIKSFNTALDIGARDGEYARYLQNYFAKTYCFDPRNRANFAYNVDLTKTTHFTCALGDERGKIPMFGGTHDPAHGKPHVVQCLRLDDFGFTDVSYMKIDVEGFEKKVLMGGEKLIRRDRPLIVIEQNDATLQGESRFAAKEWLEQRGYRHAGTCPRGWDLVMVHGDA